MLLKLFNKLANELIKKRFIFDVGGGGEAMKSAESEERENSSLEDNFAEDLDNIDIYNNLREDYLNEANKLMQDEDPELRKLGEKLRDGIEGKTQSVDDLSDLIDAVKEPDKLIKDNLDKLEEIIFNYLQVENLPDANRDVVSRAVTGKEAPAPAQQVETSPKAQEQIDTYKAKVEEEKLFYNGFINSNESTEDIKTVARNALGKLDAAVLDDDIVGALNDDSLKKQIEDLSKIRQQFSADYREAQNN